MPRSDVVVVGAGPAGRALCRSLVLRGLRVTLIDPQPDRAWTQTFGAWADELPPQMPPDTIAASMRGISAWGRRHHVLGRTYRILDTEGLQRRLADPAPHRVVADAVTGVHHLGDEAVVDLAGGGAEAAPLVIDATGSARAVLAVTDLGGEARPDQRPAAPQAAQTAVGVVVAAPAGFEATFMDWRADHGDDGPPSFLYAVHLGEDRVLYEETSLAARPPLGYDRLRQRLHDRLAARRLTVGPILAEEVVHIRVDLPPSSGLGRVVPFGAAAPLVHPATGYSVAASLRLAPRVAEAVSRADATGSTDLHGPARAVIWPAGARAVHALRSRGLERLLTMPADEVGSFFDTFFSLPLATQRAYLADRDRVGEVAAAMLRVFLGAGPATRRHLLGAVSPRRASARP